MSSAPVLDVSTIPAFPAVLENATNPAGITVAELIVDGSITDPDGPPLEAIAITALDTSLGTWQYSLDGGGHWLTIRADLINNATNELALLLGPTARLRMLPFGELNGTLSAAVTFRAWDQSSGAEGDYSVITATGGSTAFSAASDSASLTVTAVNDAPTFAVTNNGPGAVLIPVGNGADVGQSVTLQPDGKILIAGYGVNGTYNDFAIVRLNADGSLDTGFDLDGKALVALGSKEDVAYSVMVQPDGKILVGGQSDNGSNYDFSLIRLNVDGSLDTSFDGDGKALIPVGSSHDQSWCLTLQPDGKILMAGNSANGGNYDFSLIRLNADGSLDSSLDGDGKVIVTLSTREDVPFGVTLQPDGKMILAGRSGYNATYFHTALIRLNADGSLDSSFDGDGKIIIPLSANDYTPAVTVQPDGKILAGGLSWNGSNYDFALIRLNADGSLDTGFDLDGTAIIPVGDSTDYAWSLALQPDGKIIAAGTSSDGTHYDFSLIRLNADGSLDSSFGDGGRAILPVGPSASEAASVTVQPDGKILVAGYGQGAFDRDFALVRLNADGSLDSRFAGSAVNTLGGSVSYVENAAPIALDESVAVHDIELAALNGGIGNYAGASVSLARHGGASAQDLFSALGNLSLDDGQVLLSGIAIGSYTNAGGTLSIGFNDNATQARVNEALSSIGYANSSDAPPPSVQIAWTFNDGTASTTGSTTVDITAVNDAPTGSVSIAASFRTLTAHCSIGDPDGMGAVSYQWQADGADIDGATGASYVLTQAQAGHTVSVIVSYTDGGGGLESLSASVALSQFNLITGTNRTDVLTGGRGIDMIDGLLGPDIMRGGAGDDAYFVDDTRDLVVENPREGIDTVVAAVSYTLDANVENLMLDGSGSFFGKGNALDNMIVGNGADNILNGLGGSDTLTGGLGADTFTFSAAGDTFWNKPDVITDFTAAQQDKIDLSGIDAREDKLGNQAFRFIGTAEFTGNATGLLRFEAATHMLLGSTDADLDAEIAIVLVGVDSIEVANLLL